MDTKLDSPLSLRKKKSVLGLLAISPLLILFCWCGARAIKARISRPQIIFVLGGDQQREKDAAQLALYNPDLPIWVSSGSPGNYVRKIFRHAGVNLNRLHLDNQAEDTLENFTTLVDQFKARKINNVYLVTSSSHMTRAYLIGEIVFGSRGIVMRPVFVQTNDKGDYPIKSIRDALRAIWWLSTGSTGHRWFKT
jgi:uncharacterized SAM-binding protein YcdF (DUF218 family)